MFTSLRRIVTAAVPATLVGLSAIMTPAARADDPVANPPTVLTDAEKMKVRDLVFTMWKMQREDAPNETLNDALNPPGQGGSSTTYEETDRGALGRGPTRITEALSRLGHLIRAGKVMKDPCSWGASCDMKPGTSNDVVTISGKQLAIWCDPTASAVDRAKAKMQQLASLANELAHVYQIESPTLTDAQWDPVRCAGERDSDCMSIKFLERAIARMTDAMGNAHDSLADIEAEGRGGECLAKCLRDLGVDTAAEIAEVLADLRAKLAHYLDRKANLFENQINQMQSWYQLYYGGRYQSPLRLKVDAAMFRTMRILKLMFGSGPVTEFAIPNDGKTPVAYIVTVNKNGQIVVIVITWGADGSICFHVWTDTNADGMPNAGPVTTPVPAPVFPGRPVPGSHDAWLLHAPTSQLGFNDTLLLHDRRNGILAGFNLGNTGVPTGIHRTLLISPLIADPAAGNPSAGGFITLVQIDETSVAGQLRFAFLARGEFDRSSSGAVVGAFQPLFNIGFMQPPSTVAQALSPRNPTGVAHLPPFEPILLLHANPGQSVRVDSLGYGFVQPLALAVADAAGDAFADAPPLPVRSDLYNIVDVESGDQVPHAQSRIGIVADVFDGQLSGTPAPEALILSGFPGRVSIFSGNPAPAYQFMLEIATEDPDPAYIFQTSPTNPLSIAALDGETEFRPVAGTPLYAQTLIDLDGDGAQDDAAVVARQPSQPATIVFTVINALSLAPMVFPGATIPIEPAGITYLSLNADNRTDLRIADALGGPDLCLVSLGLDGFQPGPCPPDCPADFNQNGTLSVQDIFDFLAAYFGGDPRADFNNSGLISVQDIFDFLAAFFAGCP